jgi:hypothetical protein
VAARMRRSRRLSSMVHLLRSAVLVQRMPSSRPRATRPSSSAPEQATAGGAPDQATAAAARMQDCTQGLQSLTAG